MEIARDHFFEALDAMRDFYHRQAQPAPRVLFRQVAGKLELVAHGYQVWLTYHTGLPCTWKHALYVELGPLWAAVAGVGHGETVHLAKVGGGLELERNSGKFRVVFPTLAPSVFPELPFEQECGYGPPVKLDGSSWLEQMRFLTLAVCQDERHANLRALCIKADVFVASDGHRLHVAEAVNPLDGALGARDQVLVAPEVVPHLGEVDGMVLELVFGSQYLQLSAGDWVLYGALLSVGEYPDWSKVLPEERFKVVVDSSVLRRILLVMAGDGYPMELTKQPDSLLFTQSLPYGQRFAELPLEGSGRGVFPGSYLFNVKYFLEALPRMGSGPVILSGDGVEQPLKLRLMNSRVWSVVMPMRKSLH